MTKMTIITKNDVAANEQSENVEQFLNFVKSHSPFYKDSWNAVLSGPASGNALERYPLTDHAAYWQANTCLNSNVVTSEQQDGIIFKTGGKQNQPFLYCRLPLHFGAPHLRPDTY